MQRSAEIIATGCLGTIETVKNPIFKFPPFTDHVRTPAVALHHDMRYACMQLHQNIIRNNMRQLCGGHARVQAFGKHVAVMKAHLQAAADSELQVAAAKKSDNAGVRAMANATTQLAQQVSVVAQQQAAQLAICASLAASLQTLGQRSLGGFTGGQSGSSAATAEAIRLAALLSEAQALMSTSAVLAPEGPAEQPALMGSAALPSAPYSSFVPHDFGYFDKNGGIHALWYASRSCVSLMQTAFLCSITPWFKPITRHLHRNEWTGSGVGAVSLRFLTVNTGNPEVKRWRKWYRVRPHASPHQ